MGIDLSYQRIAAEKLNYLRTIHDEDVLNKYIYEDKYSSISDLDSQCLELGKLYPLVEKFLNPTNDDESLFVSVTHKGRAVIPHPYHDLGDYLNVVYFLSPEEVQSIAQALQAIPAAEAMERYRILMGDSSIEAALARTEFPTYDAAMQIIADVRQFFQHAAHAGDAILRWYS